MKKTIQFLFVIVLLVLCFPVNAQVIGIESPIQKKNVFVGVKVGVNATDMAYTITNTINNEKESFTNHSVLYQGQLLNALTGGITVERTFTHWSYGVELLVSEMNAVNLSNENHYARQDSAFYMHVRVPLRLELPGWEKVKPYVFVAPEVSTYVTSDTIALINNALNGYSEWNGYTLRWGRKNAEALNLNILAGAGLNFYIDIADYQIKGRFEVAYNMGILNTVPTKMSFAPDAEFHRSMRGWEATIGVSFPLFKNPHYQWLM
ncbi:MAG: hypothetical protein K6A28_07785 [Bacteroidales bacterium]|nr:hypothetical protein [Bacteroidales bacterium]